MVTIIALVLRVLIALVNPQPVSVVVIPPKPQITPSEMAVIDQWVDEWVATNQRDPYGCGETICNCSEHGETIDCNCWVCFEDEAYEEYADKFTALFNSYETKRAKNGALMIRRGNSGSYRFAKKG